MRVQAIERLWSEEDQDGWAVEYNDTLQRVKREENDKWDDELDNSAQSPWCPGASLNTGLRHRNAKFAIILR